MMSDAADALSTRDLYYIRAAGPAADTPRLVLKHEEAFLVADRRGDCPDAPESEFGFYMGGTRFLRTLELLVHGQQPLLLNAAVSDDGRRGAVDLTNPDLGHGEIVVLAGRTFRLARTIMLGPDSLRETLVIESFSLERHDLVVAWRFMADFADVFEVRGLIRAQRGDPLPPEVGTDSVRLSYRGRDAGGRTTGLGFDPGPDEVTPESARYRIAVPPRGRAEVTVTATGVEGGAGRPPIRGQARARPGEGPDQRVSIRTPHEQFNAWIARARTDLDMLATETPEGRIAYAGIPWYVAPFGPTA